MATRLPPSLIALNRNFIRSHFTNHDFCLSVKAPKHLTCYFEARFFHQSHNLFDSVETNPCFPEYESSDINLVKRLPKKPRFSESVRDDPELRWRQITQRLLRLPAVIAIMEEEGMWSEDVLNINAQSFESISEKLLEFDDPPIVIMMGICGEGGVPFLGIARQLLQHVRDTQIKTNFTFELSYLNLLANGLDERPELENELIEGYNAFIHKHSFTLSSPEVNRQLLRTISKTREWKRGFEILGRMKSCEEANWSDYLLLVTAAAKEGDLDVVFLLQKNYLSLSGPSTNMELLKERKMHSTSTIWNLVLDASLRMLQKNDLRSRNNMEKTLGHWRSTGFVPHLDIAKKIASWFTHHYKDQDCIKGMVKMPKNGTCPFSDKVLERLNLVLFEDLQKEFLSNVLIRDNIYVNSDPTDLASLSKFLQEHAPFDVVIDGLNIGYYGQTQTQPPVAVIQQVLKVVKHFSVGLKKKVAVVARSWWNRPTYSKILNEMQRHAFVFTAEQLTKDDLFVIHCCLESGPDCYLVSNDLYRDAKIFFRPDLRAAFAHWQHARQIHIQLDPNKSKLALVTPRQYNTVVQEIEGTIFIPHHRATEDDMHGAYTIPDLRGGTSLNQHLNIPDTFLVINPERDDSDDEFTFFETHPLPEDVGLDLDFWEKSGNSEDSER